MSVLTYHQACELARAQSIKERCTIHVNAVVELRSGMPTIVNFTLSDWFVSGQTVVSFTNGK